MIVYAPAQINSAPAQLSTAPAQPPATGAVVYTALFIIISMHFCAFLALWSRGKHTRGSSIVTKTHRYAHYPSLQHNSKFQLMPLRHSRAAPFLLALLSIFVHF